MFLLQLLSFKSRNCNVYFSNTFTLESRLFASPVFVIIWYGQKAYYVDDHYTRYGINFMVTPKALCLSLGPNEGRDTPCFDNWWILQPMEHTITAAEYAPMLHNEYIREFNLHLFIVNVCMDMVYKFAE